MRVFKKQEHGEPNPIFREEELRILSAQNQADACGNSQIIGRNGEIPLLECLRRYLPPTLRVETGFFATPDGELSPQIDILLLDARYPLLSQHSDGSVIAMLHAVVHVIEVKTTVGKREVKSLLKSAERIAALSTTVFPKFLHGSVGITAFGYCSALRLQTVEKHFYESQYELRTCDLLLLRVDPAEIGANQAIVGVELHWEPVEGTHPEHSTPTRRMEFPIEAWLESTHFTHAPLSDFYYSLVQGAYYCLDARGFHFRDIGRHLMAYMSWGTYRVS